MYINYSLVHTGGVQNCCATKYLTRSSTSSTKIHPG